MKCYAKRVLTPSGYGNEIAMPGERGLDIGCGGKKTNLIGMDIIPGVDVQHSFNDFPYPFKDEEFEVVVMTNTREHVERPVRTIEEVHRILKPGGRLVIMVPYFRSVDAFHCVDHKNFFTYHSFDDDAWGHTGTLIRYKKIGVWFGWPQKSRNPLKHLVKWFLNTFPNLYERCISKFWVIEHRIVWELEKPESKIH